MSRSILKQQEAHLLEEALNLSISLDNSLVNSQEKKQATERLKNISYQLEEFTQSFPSRNLSLNQIPQEVRKTFFLASQLLPYYSQLGSQPIAGTLTSPTLSQYSPDFLPKSWKHQNEVAELTKQLQLSDEYAKEVEQKITKINNSIQDHSTIITALIEEFNGLTTQEDALALFQNLLGDIPFPKAAVDCLATKMQVTIAINYSEKQLKDESLWSSSEPKEKQEIRYFLKQQETFDFKQFCNFPAFSHLSIEKTNSNLITTLAKKTNLPEKQISETLTRAVTIVPTSKVEAYLIHDVWGHFWQFMLTQFTEDYANLSNSQQPLTLKESVNVFSGNLTLQNLFTIQDNEIQLKVKEARFFVHGVIQKRLGWLFTHLVAEMLADMAEYKWIWDHLHQKDLLPSSSVFKTKPTKLDLTLVDLEFLYSKLLEPLLSVQSSELAQDLLKVWKKENPSLNSETALCRIQQSLEELSAIFSQEYEKHYLPKLNQSFFYQLTSNLLNLQNSINFLYTSPHSQRELPFQDFLLVFIGCYFRGDNFANFWDLNHTLTNYFRLGWNDLYESRLHSQPESHSSKNSNLRFW